jgi:hypothetical protein
VKKRTHPEKLPSFVVAPSFPLYAMKMCNFMKLESMMSHEDCMGQGLISERCDDDNMPLVFISHEWSSYKHPDPEGVQLRVVQEFLHPLVTVNDLEAFDRQTTPEQDLQRSFGSNIGMEQFESLCLSHADFVDLLVSACIWLDYYSIPQLNAANQKLAIESIPHYINSTTLFFAVTPTTTHLDRHQTVDFSSWSRRGWCRAEKMARALSTNPGPVIHITSAHCCHVAQALGFLEMRYDSSVFNGEFTCPEDAWHLYSVIDAMHASHLSMLLQQGRFDEYRYMAACRSSIFHDAPTDLLSRDQTPAPHVQGFLEHLKLGSSSASNDSKYSPLHFAVMARDPIAVHSLLLARADCRTRSSSEGFPMLGDPGSTEPILFAAVFGCNADIIEMLVSHGADVNALNSTDTASLQMAAGIQGYLHTARALLRFRALPEAGVHNSKGRIPGMNALDWAYYMGRSECVNFLLTDANMDRERTIQTGPFKGCKARDIPAAKSKGKGGTQRYR